MMKVTVENGKMTIQANNSEECLDILKYVYPLMNTGVESTPGNKITFPTPDNLKGALEDYKEQATTTSKHLGAVREYKEQQRHEEPYKNHSITENSVTVKKEVKKNLVFFLCEDCGTIACSFMNVKDQAKCYTCNNRFYLGELSKGYYSCDCGYEGVFLMQETVSEVKCKACKKDYFMIKDKVTGNYSALDTNM